MKTLQATQKQAILAAKGLTVRKLIVKSDKYVTISDGEHYVLRINKDIKSFIAKKHVNDLILTLSDATEVLVKNYFTTCGNELSCLVSIEFIDTNNLKNTYYAVDYKDAFILQDNDSLLYAYGDSKTLLSMIEPEIVTDSTIDIIVTSPTPITAETSTTATKATTSTIFSDNKVIIALGSLAAIGLSGSSAGTVVAINTIVNGVIVLGPVIAENDLTVAIYKADGSLLKDNIDVADDGSFSVDLGNYKGIIIIKAFDTDTTTDDYRDEADGQLKDLAADLLAAHYIDGSGGTVTININPITTIAAQKAGIAADGTVAQTITETAVTTSNKNIAKALGLDIDIISSKVEATINAVGDDTTTTANNYGKMLAAVSSLGDVTTAITTLIAAINDKGEVAPSVKTDMIDALTGKSAIIAVVNSMNVKLIIKLTTDSGINDNDNITNDANITTDAGSVSVEYRIKEANSEFSAWLDAYAAPTTDGTYTVAARDKNNPTDTNDLTFTLDTTTTAPTIDLVAASDTGSDNTDNITSNTKPTITGTTEAGATVKIYNGAIEVGSATADASGNYSITLTTPLNEGVNNLSAKATDTAGNTSAASSALNITIDTTGPIFTSEAVATVAVNSSSVYTANASDTGNTNTANTVTYAISGTNANLFNIDSTTGALTYKTAPTTTATNRVTVIATDTAGNSTDQILNITVVDKVSLNITNNQNKDTINSTDGDVTFTFTFSEAVTGFDATDISVNNGTKGSFTGSGTTYSLTVTPATNPATGSITIDVAADAANSVATATLTTSAATSTQNYDFEPPATPTIDLAAASDTGSKTTDNITSNTKPTITGTTEAGATVKIYNGAIEVGTGYSRC